MGWNNGVGGGFGRIIANAAHVLLAFGECVQHRREWFRYDKMNPKTSFVAMNNVKYARALGDGIVVRIKNHARDAANYTEFSVCCQTLSLFDCNRIFVLCRVQRQPSSSIRI